MKMRIRVMRVNWASELTLAKLRSDEGRQLFRGQ